MSPAQEDESLKAFNKNPEKGDVLNFDKAFIIDTDSTMQAFMLAKAKEKVVEISAVIKDMATYIKSQCCPEIQDLTHGNSLNTIR